MSHLNTYASLAAAVGLSLATMSAQAARPEAPNLSNAEFQQCLNTLKNSSQFRDVSASTFERYRPSEPDPSVIQSLNYQPEFQKDIWDYLSALVDKERVEDGIRAKHQWADTLRQIESRYGVKAEHVLGVWGVESNFGQTLGKKPLFESLATLSCFDRRQSYFRGEYANALKIVQNGDINPNDMTGSWAGAFGQTQFMPSTFLELAVDFDGDGRRDLVNSVPDALASTANFLDKRGYRSGEAWGYEVKLPDGYWAASNRKDKKSMSHWRNQGLTLANGSPLPYDLSSAGLLLPAGKDGPAFLVGKNFDTFYSYNASESYALAIAHLSDLITKEDSSKTDFITAWPTSDPGISRQQAKDIQQALLNAGYDIGGVDGIIGDNTRTAIQQYQSSRGIFPADGRAGQRFYGLIAGNDSPNNVPSSTTSYGNQYGQPSNNQTLTPAPADRMGQLIQQQTITPSTSSPQSSSKPSTSGNTRYRRITDADGVVRLVRVDEGF
ncbi:lytic murein transglycosylase [Psychrobacter urativorans]|uniref:lytic murein transglycosylase n=1 Tax=Psychrobacter urativorans TaxID=45610 RepID=UPI00191AE13F|nr:lytic murein transglycosylase [Psychrobacter urativorans]